MVDVIPIFDIYIYQVKSTINKCNKIQIQLYISSNIKSISKNNSFMFSYQHINVIFIEFIYIIYYKIILVYKCYFCIIPGCNKMMY